MSFEKKINEIVQNYNSGNFLKAESIAKNLTSESDKS